MLGTFQARLEGEATSAFDSDKTSALLAYLAIEAGRPHRRERLAGLFWSEKSERRARASLSQALHNLRKTLRDSKTNPSFFVINRRFSSTASNYTVDVNRLQVTRRMWRTSKAARLDVGSVVLALYKPSICIGRLLAGFTLGIVLNLRNGS
ncbi:winged helix-turn-helix domain-containing protein [Chloroflexi bacterium TSY]|nr:winged helix-turn-helix domain-containing protein [Chloroflexi bacterium TSY]